MDVIPVYLDEAADRANIRRDTDLHVKACGERPIGWISPRGTGSAASPRLLAEEGYLWHGDCNDDDLPAIEAFTSADGKSHQIVKIPLTMDVNDLPHTIRYGNQPASLVEHFRDVLKHAPNADGQAFMLDVTAHTHVFGRPALAWAYDAMMQIALERKDVWIGTRAEIARYALSLGKDMMR
jgi:hypothetical protein